MTEYIFFGCTIPLITALFHLTVSSTKNWFQFDFLSVLFYFSISPSTSHVFKMPCSVTIPLSLLLSLWPSLLLFSPLSLCLSPSLSFPIPPSSLSQHGRTDFSWEGINVSVVNIIPPFLSFCYFLWITVDVFYLTPHSLVGSVSLLRWLVGVL